MKRSIIFSVIFLTFGLFACNGGGDEIETLTQERDTLQAQVDELNEQISAATGESGALQTERDTLQTQVDELTVGVNDLTDQLSTVQTERDTLSARLAELEGERETLNRQVIVLAGELERSRGRLVEESAVRDETLLNIQSELETEVADMRAQLTDLSNLLSQIESERDALRVSVGVGEGLLPVEAGEARGTGGIIEDAPAAATVSVNTTAKVRALEEQAEALEERMRGATLGETGGQ